VIRSFRRLYQMDPVHVVCDLHPDYASTRFARQSGLPITSIQHHYAHVAACMAENELQGKVLGISWDGTGYGQDGTVWGGEFLLTNDSSFTRVASFRRFRLPGSAAAIKEPRRSAIGVLYEILGADLFKDKSLLPVRSFSAQDAAVLSQMLGKGLHSPRTTSAGRLFDAIASLCGLRQVIKYEGQAAMELEFAVGKDEEQEYPFEISNPETSDHHAGMVVDWEPLIRAILQDVQEGISPSRISRRFHDTLVKIIIAVARQAAEERVVLTGGCFQNKFLLEHAVQKLEHEGFRPYWHQRVPPSDGGIALGQIAAVSRILREVGP